MLNEENSKVEVGVLLDKVQQLHESLEDIKNVVQLLEMSLVNNEDDKHIVRSVNIINKMLNTVLNDDMVALKELIQHEE